jgi:small subunit ribosomal protein S8
MDIVSNMLITIKNGGNAGKNTVIAPYSNYKHKICETLVRLGYIKAVHKKTAKGGFPELVIELELEGKTPKIKGLRRVSKPSRRLYSASKAIRTIRSGFGEVVLSTPKGILGGQEAKEKLVGGELLFEIW